MVAYSFKAQFAQPILAGTKGGTIRADRKRHARPGEELQLYTAMRTKHCRLIGRRPCVGVTPIFLDFVQSCVQIGKWRFYLPANVDTFARFDGFATFAEMASFWDGVDRFDGWHIRWLPLPAYLAEATE